MKTGNTGRCSRRPRNLRAASMEPGHEDREYDAAQVDDAAGPLASMEPGHEDREYELDPVKGH